MLGCPLASLGLGAGFGAGWLVFLLESCGGEPRWGESAFFRFSRFLGVGVGVFFVFYSFSRFFSVFLCFFLSVFLGFPGFSSGVGVGLGQKEMFRVV